jgi:hypothetical protein
MRDPGAHAFRRFLTALFGVAIMAALMMFAPETNAQNAQRQMPRQNGMVAPRTQMPRGPVVPRTRMERRRVIPQPQTQRRPGMQQPRTRRELMMRQPQPQPRRELMMRRVRPTRRHVVLPPKTPPNVAAPQPQTPRVTDNYAGGEQDRVRQAREAGQIKSFGEIKKTITRRFNGHIIGVDLDQDDPSSKNWTYQVRMLSDNGKVVVVRANAATGEIVDVKGQK